MTGAQSTRAVAFATPAIRPVILVVDDDTTVQAAFRLILEERYRVETASTGREALGFLSLSRVDLVLLDLLMPGADGLEVLQHLSRFATKPKTIVVTGLDYAALAVAALQLGAIDYVTKPFDEDSLLATIERTLAPASPCLVVRSDDLGARVAVTAALILLSTVPVLSTARKVVEEVQPNVANGFIDLPETLDLHALTTIVRNALPTRRISQLSLKVVKYAADRFPVLAVDNIAQALHVPRGRLSSAFRIDFGVTPKSYLMRVQVEAAKSLLIETTDTLETIADRVGLCDSAHLSRIFAQKVGTPPGRYRQDSRPSGSYW